MDCHYQSTILPANVAVESTLSRLLTDFLENTVSKKRAEDFLTNAATYSHQLNVLLPALVKNTSVPLLPDEIRGKLNRLRELRHEMAHKGFIDQILTKDETAECLCAALFGFHYLNLIRPRLIGSEKT